MIAGPLLLLILPLAMAGIVYIVLRWSSLAALLSFGTALALGVAVVTLPLDQPVQVGEGRQIALGETVVFFGRELALEQADRMAMAFLFLTAAGIFLLAWRFTPHSLLFPMGLGMLSLLSGALLIQPLIYAALLIEIAAAFSVFALQAEGQPPTRGGMRFLTFTTMALPGLLVTHWLMDRYALTPDETGLLGASAVLLTISFALLLGAVPFHTWVPAVAGEGVPLAGVFVLTVSNGATWFLLLEFLETYPWLSVYPRFDDLLFAVGLVMVIVGGGLAPAQRRLGPLMGYAALIDSGATIIALGMNSRLGMTLTFLALLMRPFGLSLMAVGLSGLRARSGGDDGWDALRGLGWQAPWSTTALVFGGLAVSGLPISAGFISRWALCRALAPSSPGAALLLLLAGMGVMFGVWRGLFILLVRPRSPEDRSVVPSRNSGEAAEGWLMRVLITLAVLGCLGIGLFPQSLATLATRLAETYTFFLP